VHPSKAVPWGYAHEDGWGRGPSEIANHVYASPEGQIHRNDGHAWQRYTTRGWQTEQPSVSLERAAQARDLGASRVDALRHAYVGEAPRTSALARRPVARPMGTIGQARWAFAGGGFHGATGGGFHMGGGMHGGGGIDNRVVTGTRRVLRTRLKLQCDAAAAKRSGNPAGA